MTVMSKSKTAAKRESRVAEILDCAEIHFVEKGFHGAGISGIAKECGISVGHLYHYFASKDLLIEAVVERELLRQKDDPDPEYQSHWSPHHGSQHPFHEENAPMQ